MTHPKVDAVVIGRNEGARLITCLGSVKSQVRRMIYVDSGSSDGSVEAARHAGAQVLVLDLSVPFTAARARNVGWKSLSENPPDFVQFIDGDCELQPGWVPAALEKMASNPLAAVVCGRRRERWPQKSIYNGLIDLEWDTPVGQAKACGGDALIRYAALAAAGGYRDDLIAGEEPELCLRLRQAGGEIWRIDAEMTLHDAALTRFSQWWRRARRAGFAFAEGAALHGEGPDRHWVRETRRALFWGALLPVAIVLGALAFPVLWFALLVYPIQIVRLSKRGGLLWGAFTVLGKFPEAVGALEYYIRRLADRRRGLIEYK
ncbi:glycosyltransferase family 2 protein [Thioclava sp. FR2]|uniref:glycosyltransferase family 2 protein n=1 Tax=Thioclava sp. FR2 TaxID=3445780 RepID=UPI003EBF237D